jgi:hypothetical protein
MKYQNNQYTVIPAPSAQSLDLWVKTALGVAFVSANVAIAERSVSSLQSAHCETVNCTEVQAKAKPAYTLRIVNYGEGQSKVDAPTPIDLQADRRVDVSFEGVEVKVPESASFGTLGSGKIWLTQDPLSIERRLDITAASRAKVTDGVLSDPIRLSVFSNYASYISAWQIVFYAADDMQLKTPLAQVNGTKLGYDSILEWNGVLDDGSTVAAGDEYIYVLRVSDKDGNTDETFPQALSIDSAKRFIAEPDTRTLTELALEARKQRSTLAKQAIPISGSRVRVYGRDLGNIATVTINGEQVTLDANKDFAAEYILADGQHDFNVVVSAGNGATYNKKLEVDLKDNYMFLVALADITVSKNTVKGGISKLDLEDDARYGGDIFVDGRLAFYLKGKVKGKYLLTAQLDTDHREIDQIFNGLNRDDPRSVFRRLDPEQYYPVYGDDSTLVDDTDSQGKLYVRVDWDQSRALWGNFNTGVTGTELANFNRSLYGAQLQHRSLERTDTGEHKTDVNVFASEAQSVARHNRLRGTGGSLYYLSDQDIVIGSEKLAVEIRDRETGRVISREALVEGRDYQVDHIQGRIILNQPLLTVGNQVSPSIIKDAPLDGNEVWLTADYEFVPQSFDADEATYGVRGKHWLNDHFSFGGTWVLENRDGSDREIRGVDATLFADAGTWLRAEYAKTTSAQTTGSFTSDDGGLNFEPFDSNNTAPSGGNGYSLEARLDIAERLEWLREASAGAWVKQRDAGFSGGGYDSGTDTRDIGLEFNAEINDKMDIAGRATSTERTGVSSRDTASVQVDYDLTDRVSLAAELRRISERDEPTASSGRGVLTAIQAAVDVRDGISVYGALQETLDASGTYERNDRYTLGVDAEIGNNLSLNAEASTGDAGDALQGGVQYRLNDKSSIYLNQNLSTDRTDRHRNTTTIGQRHQVSDKVSVFTEHQFTDEDQNAGLGHTFGLELKPATHTTLSASYQVANFSAESGGTTDRDAITVGYAYKQDKTHASARLEYRRDKSDSVDTEQWLTANSVNYIQNDSLRWQGKLNLSKTDDKTGGDNTARFTEAGIGFAYRPVNNDRLNMLGRLTHYYDLPPLSQASVMDEKSLIGSLEFAWQVNQRWEAGGKFAYKESEVRADRDAGDWADNDATLLASILRYHLRFKWDADAEYQWLQSDASDDLKHGARFSVGRHVGDHVKLAVGYNFTRFDDSKLERDYDVRGWFVNLIGKY